MAYTLTLTEDERQALAWIADRYECASVLYDGMTGTSPDDCNEAGEQTFAIPEHVAWAYVEACETENGCGVWVPPCAGGTLAEKLSAFREAIV